MRDEEENEDSLDLMLDTLCNAFGGIILITLLIALMSQEAGQEIEQPRNFSNEAMILKIKMQNLQDDLEDAEFIHEKLEKEKDESVDDKISEKVARLSKRSADREKVKLEIKLAKKAIDETPQDTSDLAEQLNTVKESKEKDLEKLKDRLEFAQDRIDDTKDEFDSMDDEISKSKRDKTKKLRLPKEKGRSDKKPLWVVVRYGKLYLILRGNAGNRTINSNDFGTKTIKQPPETLLLLTPLRTRGISLPRERATFLRYLATIAKRSEFLQFEVYPDDQCFNAFNLAKNLAQAQDIGYAWLPDDEEPFVLTTGKGDAPRPEL